jgi:hypothetical protein
MKKVILLLILLVSFDQLHSQIVDNKIDNRLYQDLIEQLKFDKNEPIYYKTSLTVLKRIDVKTIAVDKWSVVNNTNKNYVQFLNQVSLEGIHDFELNGKIGDHSFTKKMYELVNNRPQSFIVISPVVYSSDKTLAICSIFDWKGPEQSSETIYLSELKNNKWEIIRFLLVRIS